MTVRSTGKKKPWSIIMKVCAEHDRNLRKERVRYNNYTGIQVVSLRLHVIKLLNNTPLYTSMPYTVGAGGGGEGKSNEVIHQIKYKASKQNVPRPSTHPYVVASLGGSCLAICHVPDLDLQKGDGPIKPH